MFYWNQGKFHMSMDYGFLQMVRFIRSFNSAYSIGDNKEAYLNKILSRYVRY